MLVWSCWVSAVADCTAAVGSGFRQSTLAGELSKPVVGSLLRANQLIADAKQDSDFELVFSPVDLKTGGVLVVTDAALGNVDVSGFDESPSHKKVFSQTCYLIAFADGELMQGRTGTLVPLDSRSHRISRVGRSSYAVETMGFEEGVDAAQLIRAMLAELQGHPVDGRNLLKAVDKVPMLGVIDAKDAHDKVASDNNSWGSLKILRILSLGCGNNSVARMLVSVGLLPKICLWMPGPKTCR